VAIPPQQVTVVRHAARYGIDPLVPRVGSFDPQSANTNIVFSSDRLKEAYSRPPQLIKDGAPRSRRRFAKSGATALAHRFIRNRTTWLAYLMLAFYGYFLNVFGPITPFLKNELNLSYTVSSLHFSAFALGIIGAGLIGHNLIQKLGHWNSLWIAAFGMSLCALLLIAGRDPLVTIGAAFVMGLVGSLILAIVPTILSNQHGEMRAVAFSEANVIASLLSAVAPVLVGWFAPTVLGWRAALVIAALASLVMRFAFGTLHLPPAQISADSEHPQRRLPALYWIYWTALVVAVSVEFCMIFWSADYLETGLGLPKTDAAQAVSLFLVGMIVGRVASSRLVQRFTAHQVTTGSLIIAAIGFLIYWTAAAPIFGIVGLLITGLGVASLYPLLLSLAVGSARGNTIRASAFSSLASGVAIFALPLILGRLADAVGIRSAYAVIILLLVVAFLIVLGTARFSLALVRTPETSHTDAHK
jgi:fucose permease